MDEAVLTIPPNAQRSLTGRRVVRLALTAQIAVKEYEDAFAEWFKQVQGLPEAAFWPMVDGYRDSVLVRMVEDQQSVREAAEGFADDFATRFPQHKAMDLVRFAAGFSELTTRLAAALTPKTSAEWAVTHADLLFLGGRAVCDDVLSGAVTGRRAVTARLKAGCQSFNKGLYRQARPGSQFDAWLTYSACQGFAYSAHAWYRNNQH